MTNACINPPGVHPSKHVDLGRQDAARVLRAVRVFWSIRCTTFRDARSKSIEQELSLSSRLGTPESCVTTDVPGGSPMKRALVLGILVGVSALVMSLGAQQAPGGGREGGQGRGDEI